MSRTRFRLVLILLILIMLLTSLLFGVLTYWLEAQTVPAAVPGQEGLHPARGTRQARASQDQRWALGYAERPGQEPCPLGAQGAIEPAPSLGDWRHMKRVKHG